MKLSDLHCENYVVLSVLGPHAGESEGQIFRRKMLDVRRVRRTFWLHRSSQANPDAVQNICELTQEKHDSVYCVFIEPSQPGGAHPTKTGSAAKSYSRDRKMWHELPKKLSPVTGRIDKGAFALVFDFLEYAQGPDVTIDLWDYADFNKPESPIKFQQGRSTVCAIRKDMSKHPEKIKSHRRRVIAIARLVEPFCVWLKE